MAGYTTPTVWVPYGRASSTTGNWVPLPHGTAHSPYGHYAVGVAVPNPSSPPPTAGHWRTNGNPNPCVVRGLGSAVPTGGRGLPQPRVANTPKRRRRRAKPSGPTAAQLHAAWAKGTL
jgi:hypothetical protein